MTTTTQLCTNTSSVFSINSVIGYERGATYLRKTDPLLLLYHNNYGLLSRGCCCELGKPGSRNMISISTRCCSPNPIETLTTTRRTCKNCKSQFDPSLNNPRACRYHTAHFGGETKRKFESVHTGGTMNTPESGKISQYWHCCGSEDPFDPGCTAAPHFSYDD